MQSPAIDSDNPKYHRATLYLSSRKHIYKNICCHWAGNFSLISAWKEGIGFASCMHHRRNVATKEQLAYISGKRYDFLIATSPQLGPDIIGVKVAKSGYSSDFGVVENPRVPNWGDPVRQNASRVFSGSSQVFRFLHETEVGYLPKPFLQVGRAYPQLEYQ